MKSESKRSSVNTDILKNAINDDGDAIILMFRQFIDHDEKIISTHYTGLLGIWQIGYHYFLCSTDKRISSIEIGWLGSVKYHEIYLEDITSIEINQPSLFSVYAWCFIFIIITFGLGIIFLPYVVRITFFFIKSGISVSTRTAQKLEAFCDRQKSIRINRFSREICRLRDRRLHEAFDLNENGHPSA